MLRSILIAVGAAVLLAVGALTAAAANSHGKTVSTLATGTTLKGEAKGDAISTLASTKSDVANAAARDRKSTRLNSSHLVISYAVFCLKKKKKKVLLPATHHDVDVQLEPICISRRYDDCPVVEITRGRRGAAGDRGFMAYLGVRAGAL